MKAELIYHGHSCFEVIGRDRILIDPFLKDNPLADVVPDELEPDIIAVTHGHGDHLGDAVEISERTGAPVVSIAEIAWYLSGIIGNKAIGMNMGGTAKIKNTEFTMVRADHSSGLRTEKGQISGGQAAGIIIDSGFRIYHLGDTALFLDLKIYRTLFSPQVVLIPIGGYYTMDPKQAALAAGWLEPRVVVPMHYNTWPVINQDPEIFREYVKGLLGEKTEVIIPQPGMHIDLTTYLKEREEKD